VKPLTLADIAPRTRYESLRPDFLLKLIDLKDRRRVAVGDRVTVVFENRETLRFQIQEMCRVERIDDPRAVQHELDVYNELMPPSGGLSATLFIEIPELERIRAELDRLVGLDEHVSLQVGDASIPALFDEKQMEEERISAVQYIRFHLKETHRLHFAEIDTPVVLRIDHPNYRFETQLTPRTRRSLMTDLLGECPELMSDEELAGGVAACVELLEETDSVRVVQVAPGHRIVVPRSRAAEGDALELALLHAARRHAAELGPDARIELESAGERPRWHVRATTS
jgi:hypothetical protein